MEGRLRRHCPWAPVSLEPDLKHPVGSSGCFLVMANAIVDIARKPWLPGRIVYPLAIK